MGDGRWVSRSWFTKCSIHWHLSTLSKSTKFYMNLCSPRNRNLLRGIFVFCFECLGQRVLLNLLHSEKYSVAVNALIVKGQYPLRKLTVRHQFPEIPQKDVINFMRNIESNSVRRKKRKKWKEHKSERSNPYYFFRANQWKANIKIYSWTQCDPTVNGCDWHILVDNDERIVLHFLTWLSAFFLGGHTVSGTTWNLEI